VTRTAAVIVYVAGLVFAETLRVPRRIGHFRSCRLRNSGHRRRDPFEYLVMAAVILGIWVLPLTYVVTPWLQPLDYSLPRWTSWIAAPVFAVSLLIRLIAHRTLGTQWSGTVEVPAEHRLVTAGIYGRVRHPIYASLVLWAAAQPALLQNLAAGWGGAVAVAIIWLLRVPREEQMMLEEFDGEYSDYMARTGQLVPTRRRRGPIAGPAVSGPNEPTRLR
jgi:protein-S-isoprenylcysteine O-methyltransferase Ste14